MPAHQWARPERLSGPTSSTEGCDGLRRLLLDRRAERRAPTVIMVTGAHSTGKTTLCHDLADALHARGVGVSIMENVARKVGMIGLPLGQMCTMDTYFAIVAAHLKNISEPPDAEVCILDRYVLDIHAYARANGNISGYFDQLLIQIYGHCMKVVDAVLYLPVEIPLIADGVRDESVSFRNRVDLEIQGLLAEVWPGFTTIRGEPRDRLATAMSVVASKATAHG